MVWGKPASGAWANAVEEEEQEHGTIQAPATAPERDFPSLGVAVTVKETKKDKKKKQTMSLGDFMSSGGSSSRRYDDPVINLPTAPRGRVEGEEDANPLGGGFRSYGGDRYGGGGRGGGSRFGDREDRGPRRERDEEDLGPSRADTADNWGAERKFVPGGGSGGDRYERRDSSAGGFRDRGSFGGGFRDGEDRPPRREFDDGPSRADTGDWGARQFVPSTSSRRSYDEPRGGGGGFRERESFRDRGEFKERESFREPTKADLEDRWERHGEVKPTGFDDRPRRPFDEAPRERRGFSDGWRGREQEVSGGAGSRDGSRDQWRKERAGPGPEEDAGAPRERPKLVLKPRTASTDARPAEDAGRPSIFGAARPREEVLREQGRDPVEEDERLEAAAKAAGKPRKEKHTDEEAAAATAAVHAKIAEAKAKAEDESATEEDKTKATEEIAALEAELTKLKVGGDEKPAFRGRDGERGERRERGSGGFGGGENGRGGERSERSERSDSRRRENGSSFRRRDDRERDGSRGRTGGDRGGGGGGGDRW